MNQQALWDAFYKKQSWQRETTSLPKGSCTGKRILELGCGNGKTLRAILAQEPRAVVAVDFSAQALKQAQETIKDKRVTFVQAEVFALPHELGKFDSILCYYLLNNLSLKEQKKFFSFLNSFLTSSGTLFIEDYAKGDYRENKKSLFKRTFLTKAALTQVLQNYQSTITEHAFTPYKKASATRKIIRAIATQQWFSN
ncbi:class I SAM-dependent methyltransferase [Candidatus Pacearchaeota archaeon]|nr:class I SAM-dependent methyltransferase [Candidatus Pacearchaeota archaeon]